MNVREIFSSLKAGLVQRGWCLLRFFRYGRKGMEYGKYGLFVIVHDVVAGMVRVCLASDQKVTIKGFASEKEAKAYIDGREATIDDLHLDPAQVLAAILTDERPITSRPGFDEPSGGRRETGL